MASVFRKHLKVWVGLIISAAAIYLSLHKINYQLLWASLKSLDILFVLPAIFIQITCFIFKGAAWKFLLSPTRRDVPLSATISVLTIGLMVNNLFPAKMGELARAYLLGEKEKIPKSLVLSTVGVEHLLDIIILLIFLLLLLPGVNLPDWLRITGTTVGFVALILIFLIFLVMRREENFLNWLFRIGKFLPEKIRGKSQNLTTNFVQGFRVVTGRYLFYALAMLFPMWIMSTLFAYLIMFSFSLSLPFKAAVMVVIFVAFGKIIPSSPSALGTYHYLVILVLTSFQIGKEVALSYAIILHGLASVVEIIAGLVALLTGNFSWSNVTRRWEGSA